MSVHQSSPLVIVDYLIDVPINAQFGLLKSTFSLLCYCAIEAVFRLMQHGDLIHASMPISLFNMIVLNQTS